MNRKVDIHVLIDFSGVMSGINMSGDLSNPQEDIPKGTIAVSQFFELH